ncbi:MAG TPA: hypothetical protein PKN32_06520 [Bacteroidales bacterium]|nr:hypothetical protein [Bacteroidales bacterium]
MMMNKNYNGLKNNPFKLIVLLMISSTAYFTFSCASSEIADSKDVNQAKIYQSYTVHFDAESPDSYNVTAQFRFGGNKGTTLRLSAPSKVTVNDSEMEEKSDSFSGCYYQTNLKGLGEFNFKFIDTENKEFLNSVILNPVTAKVVELIDADIKNSIYWEGLPLAAHETVCLTICDNEGNCATGTTDIVGADYVVISPSDMDNLVSGKGNYYLTRTYSNSIKNAADEGGNIYTDYKSVAVPVKIIKKPSQDTANK